MVQKVVIMGAAGRDFHNFNVSLTLDEAVHYQDQGHFPPGSMGPKIEAAMRFLRSGGKRAVISSITTIEAAVTGNAGTEPRP